MPAPLILVVDDDKNIRELLGIHLRNAGYDVQVAADGVEAGYAVLRSRPSLIITDVNMPHLDGFEFVEALRAEAPLADVPVIFLTSSGLEAERGKALRAVGFIEKPVRADRLLALVAEHVPGGKHPIG